MVYARKRRFARRRPVRRRYVKRRIARKNTRFHKRGRRNPMHARITRVRGVGLSDVVWQKFRYAENNFKFPLGSADTIRFVNMSLNNPYDPYYSLGGKSALYFQQAASSYKYIRTYGASITLRITDVPAAIDRPIGIAFVLNSNFNIDIGTPDADDILSLPKNRCRIMKLYPNRIGGTRMLKMFVHISDVFYMTRQQYDAAVPGDEFDVTNFGGFADPLNYAWCSIYWFRIDTNDTSELEVVGDVTITFYTKMWCKQPFTEPGSDHVNPEPEEVAPLTDDAIFEKYKAVYGTSAALSPTQASNILNESHEPVDP